MSKAYTQEQIEVLDKIKFPLLVDEKNQVYTDCNGTDINSLLDKGEIVIFAKLACEAINLHFNNDEIPASDWVKFADDRFPLENSDVEIWTLLSDKSQVATFRNGVFERYANYAPDDRCGLYYYKDITHWKYLSSKP